MALIITPGGSSADSYITVEEAEIILANTGLVTESWSALSDNQGLRYTGRVSGPFLPLTGISDTLLFAVGEGTDQEITIACSLDDDDNPIPLTSTQVCVALNAQVSGFTFTTTADSRIVITTTVATDTLYIKPVDTSAYTVFGFVAGTYEDHISYSKEYILKLAAELIGFMPIRGERVYEYQALDFPRTVQRDTTMIPVPIKEAQAILASLVVLPNLLEQISMSDEALLPTSLQNAIVDKVKVAGIMDVSTTSTSSSSGGSTSSTTTYNMMQAMTSAFALPAYLRMKPYISQIRGGTLISPEDFVYPLLDEVVEEA
jgi:hypothetical protein